jgi:hypothetical protein
MLVGTKMFTARRQIVVAPAENLTEINFSTQRCGEAKTPLLVFGCR